MIMTTTTNATTARIPNFLVVAGVGVFDMPNIDPREAISEKKVLTCIIMELHGKQNTDIDQS